MKINKSGIHISWGMSFLVTFIIQIHLFAADSLKISQDVSLGLGAPDGSYKKAAIISLNGTPLNDFSAAYVPNASYGKRGAIAEDDAATKVVPGKSLIIVGRSYDKDYEDILKYSSEFKMVDATNAVVRTEFNYLQDYPWGGQQIFYFPLEKVPSGTTVEVIGADGKSKLFDNLVKHEIDMIKEAKKVIVKHGKLIATFEPGKGSVLVVRDTRTQDQSPGSINVWVENSRGNYKKGEKQVLECKFSMRKN